MGTMTLANIVQKLSLMLTWTLIDSSVKAAMLLATAVTCTWVLRRGSAAIRDRIWTLAFSGAILLPAISSIVPQCRIPAFALLSTANTASQSDVTVDKAIQSDTQLTDPDIIVTTDVQPQLATGTKTLVVSDEQFKHPGLSASPQTAASTVVTPFPNSGSRVASIADYSGILVIVWLMGVFIAALPFVVAVMTARAMTRRGRNTSDPSAQQILDETSRRLGLSRRATLIDANSNLIPMTVGVIRSKVMLPSNWKSWPVVRLRLVMLHELAHVKRLDVLFQSIARIACAIYWFNPLAWYSLHRMRIDCELACDDHVISMGEPASTYAGELIEIARSYRPARFASGISMARSSRLEGRIVSLLDGNRPHHPVGRKSGRLLIMLSAGLVFALAALTVEKQAAIAVEPEGAVVKTAVAIDDLNEVAANRKADDSKAVAKIERREGLPFLNGGKDLLGRNGAGIFFAAANHAARVESGIDDEVGLKVQNIAERYCDVMFGSQQDAWKRLRAVIELKDVSEEERAKRIKDSMEKRETNSEETHEKLFADLRATITADQLNRLQQIAWQAYGGEALELDRGLAKTIELTKDQAKRVREILREFQPKQYELHRFEGSFGEFQKLYSERDAKVKELLTNEQREQLVKLVGKPFDIARLTSQGRRKAFGWFGGGAGIVMIAGSKSVQNELGLSEDAAKKLSELSQTFFITQRDAGTWRLWSDRIANGTTVNFSEPATPSWDYGQWNALIAKFVPQLRQILTTDQYARLQQIHWQAMGTAAYLDDEVVQLLEITKEQREKIIDVTEQYRVKRQALLNVVAGRDPVDPYENVLELVKDYETKVDTFLTKAQLNQFAILKGKEFDLQQLRTLDLTMVGVPPAGIAVGGGNGGRVRRGQIVVPDESFGDGIFSVMKNSAVQKELGFTTETANKVQKIDDQFSRAWNEVGGGYRIRQRRRVIALVQYQEAVMPPKMILPIRGQSAEDRALDIARMLDLWNATIAKFLPQLKDLLTTEQFSRLQEIAWQAMGTSAYLYSDVSEALAVTKEQRKAITSVMVDYDLRNRKLLSQAHFSGVDDNLPEKLRELTKEQDAKINELMTAEQLAKFAAMKGKGFDLSQLRDDARFGDSSGIGGATPPLKTK